MELVLLEIGIAAVRLVVEFFELPFDGEVVLLEEENECAVSA
jgi:hypothetical protein